MRASSNIHKTETCSKDTMHRSWAVMLASDKFRCFLGDVAVKIKMKCAVGLLILLPLGEAYSAESSSKLDNQPISLDFAAEVQKKVCEKRRWNCR